MTLEARLRCAAIEKYLRHGAMLAKERREIICHLRASHNRRIQTARSLAILQHVPYGNACALQRPRPLRIRCVRRKAQRLTHDSPKRILRMRVILPRRERGHAGHAAQDHPRCLRVSNRRETLKQGNHRY